jgi:hypothetical protein
VAINTQTRGVHGITCIGGQASGSSYPGGIYLDGNNNTLDDIYIEGFYDGVVLGDSGSNAVAGNVLSNVRGSASGAGALQNVVHICNPASPVLPCTSTAGAVTDLSILQAASLGYNNGNAPATTIRDDLTGAMINSSSYPAFAGMYVLGGTETVNTSTAYSRFATSPGPSSCGGGSCNGVPTWGVGNTAVTDGAACTSAGALYSNTAGTSGSTIYVCVQKTQYGPLGWYHIL